MVDGFDDDLEVEERRPVLDIVDVESAAFFERYVTAAGDLGEAGEAGFDGEDEVAVGIVLEFAGVEGARADEGDVAF